MNTNHTEILAKYKSLTSLKGPRPHLKPVMSLIEKHGSRLDTVELETAIASLTKTRNENLAFSASVKEALAAQAQDEANKAKALVPVTETPVVA